MMTNTFLKQLLFSTVRITANLNSEESIGTGFLIQNKISEEKKQLFLVTNKHVIAKTNNVGQVLEKFTKGSFSFLKSENGCPKLGDSIQVEINQLTDKFFLHPNEAVDLAICNISELCNNLETKCGYGAFIKTIPLEMIPDSSQAFDVIEDVLFVGYPNGIFDKKNHLPIMRQGITASPYEVDFDGEKKFIIDAQVFPGSSGSPVFIKEQKMKNGVLSLSPDKYFFVGVISKVFCRTETGSLLQKIAPTMVQLGNFSLQQMIGLGICEKSSQILNLIKIFNNQLR